MIDKDRYTLQFADNGRLAYEAFQKERFDLVLMDIGMPEMDGTEALKAIRAFEKSRNSAQTPIIAVTAHVMGGDKEKLLDMGFNAYLGKPLIMQALNDLIEKWTKANKTNAA